ncbi:hypothetical protein CAOG_01624 [Capsaspora owczarzaki ATCC 30864]|uniref:F-box domain-containing protein n=1 Tax=Capsaspora owczarzaki (strain ATCC 30864) TaxID=595528 RepID=A0A0D2U559_CAPO3|nr:hypothetical protein CAOG_01624 [Capsaspora owczarzaki ATCC 30864]KJE90291.1 hypothetical protein CAOG_001624 [Capsaspora owczarzaki ATCC 30864]|eukprot:XP_004364492.1 hypothetical protein CAOG_01624 [Capsaspora owczarzaki ATCC 30864]
MLAAATCMGPDISGFAKFVQSSDFPGWMACLASPTELPMLAHASTAATAAAAAATTAGPSRPTRATTATIVSNPKVPELIARPPMHPSNPFILKNDAGVHGNPNQALGLFSLPAELIELITDMLSLPDLWRLSGTCRAARTFFFQPDIWIRRTRQLLANNGLKPDLYMASIAHAVSSVPTNWKEAFTRLQHVSFCAHVSILPTNSPPEQQYFDLLLAKATRFPGQYLSVQLLARYHRLQPFFVDHTASKRSRHSALSRAIMARNFPMVKYFLHHKVSPNCHETVAMPPIVSAVEINNVEMIQLLAAAGAHVNGEPNSKRCDSSSRAIIRAVTQGKRDCVAALLALGADPNTIVSGYHSHSVLALNVLQLNRNGATAAELADELDITRLLLAAGADPNAGHAFHLACEGSNLDALETLIKHGGDVNSRRTNSLKLPIEVAAAKGNVPAAEVLLKHGSLPELGGFATYLQIMLAAMKDSSNLSPEAESDLALVDSKVQTTPRMVFREEQLLDTLRWLIERNVPFVGKAAILVDAVQANAYHLVEHLLDHAADIGLDVNLGDCIGRTALSRAMGSGRLHFVDALVRHGVDIDIADVDGRLAVDMALQAERYSALLILVRHHPQYLLALPEAARERLMPHLPEDVVAAAQRTRLDSKVSEALLQAIERARTPAMYIPSPLMDGGSSRSFSGKLFRAWRSVTRRLRS